MNRNACVIDYLTKHGPTPRPVAFEGIARLYLERHVRSRSQSIGPIKEAFALHLRDMASTGMIVRKDNVLSLPTS